MTAGAGGYGEQLSDPPVLDRMPTQDDRRVRGASASMIAVLAAGALVGCLAAPSVLAGQQPKNLAGRWELRDRAAHDSAEAARRAEPSPPPELRSPPQREGREGRRGGRGGGMSVEDRMEIGRLVGMSQVVPAFEIAQTDSTIVVTNEGGFSYTLYPDGRTTELRLGDELTVEVKSQWKDGHLEVEFKPEGGGKLTEVYALADSRLFLRVEVTVEHGRLRQPVWESRMYRRLDP